MRRLIVSAMVAVVAIVAGAADKTWVGADGGDWGSESNWNPAGVPTVEDVAIFSATNSINIGSGFVGVDTLRINGTAEVTLNLSADAELKVYVNSTAKMKVNTSGTLTLIPAEGANKGEISVLSGNVVFKKNPIAPSMFGMLTLASGVNATVADSPAENRHGMHLKYMKFSNGTLATACEEAIKPSYATMESYWKTGEVTATSWTASTNTAKTVGLDGGCYFCDPYDKQATSYFVAIGRVSAVLIPNLTKQMVSTDYYFDDSGRVFLNESNFVSYFHGNGAVSRADNIMPGLHDYVFVYREDGSNQHTRFLIHTEKNQDGSLHPDMLWNGVCFNGVKIAEGATLTIADNQAVGFALLTGSAINGRIVGGTSSYCSLLVGELAISDSGNTFGDFVGTLEVGRFSAVKATAGSSSGGFGFGVLNYGELHLPASVTWDGTKDIHYGCLSIPEGTVVRVTGENLKECGLYGEGTLNVTGGFNSDGLNVGNFKGEVVSDGGAVVDIDCTLDGNENSRIQLSDGDTLRVGYDAVTARELQTKHIISGFTSGWATNGTATSRDFHKINPNNPNPVIVDDGCVIMTEDSCQTHTICYTNMPVKLNDAWEVSFTFSCEALSFYAKEHFAEGLACVIQPQNGGLLTFSGNTPQHGEGIFLRTYNDSANKLWWVLNGRTSDNNGFTSTQLNGISVTSKPVDVRLSYDGKKYLTVELKQGNKTFVASRVLSVIYKNQDIPYYLTISARTGSWTTPESQAVVKHIVSNFTGSITKMADRIDVKDSYALSAENWHLSSGTNMASQSDTIDYNVDNIKIRIEEGEMIFPTPFTSLFSAYCKTPFKLSKPWRAEFDYKTRNFVGYTGSETFCVLVHTNSPTEIGVKYGHQWRIPASAYGIGINTYSLNQIFYVKKGRYSSTYETLDFTLKNMTTHVVVDYDGCGTLSFTLSQGLNYPKSMSVDISEAFSSDADVYFGFGGVVGGSLSLENVIANLSFGVYEPVTTTFSSPVDVAENSTVSLDVATLQNVNDYSTVFSDMTLAVGSTLNVENAYIQDGDYRVKFEETTFAAGGNATLKSLNGVTELSRLVFSGATPVLSKLVGKFAAEELELVIPAAWAKLSEVPLLDVSGVTWESGRMPLITVVDDEGNPVNMAVSTSNGIIRLLKSGTIFIIR